MELQPISEITLERDHKRPLRFKGTLVTAIRTEWDRNRRSQRLALYRWRPEAGGWGWVCEKVGYSQNEGETTRYTAETVHTEEEVMRFFGFGAVAKRLYEDADIDCAEDV